MGYPWQERRCGPAQTAHGAARRMPRAPEPEHLPAACIAHPPGTCARPFRLRPTSSARPRRSWRLARRSERLRHYTEACGAARVRFGVRRVVHRSDRALSAHYSPACGAWCTGATGPCQLITFRPAARGAQERAEPYYAGGATGKEQVRDRGWIGQAWCEDQLGLSLLAPRPRGGMAHGTGAGAGAISGRTGVEESQA